MTILLFVELAGEMKQAGFNTGHYYQPLLAEDTGGSRDLERAVLRLITE